MRVKITKDELDKNFKLIEPGWYQTKIVGVETKPAKSDGSTNYILKLAILEGPETGTKLQRYYSEKALGFFGPLLAALEAPKDDQGEYDIELENLKGRNVDTYVARGTDDKKRPTNEVSDFRKYTGTAA
jgi:hypothetical protein